MLIRTVIAIGTLICTFSSVSSVAQTEVKGDPESLKAFLHPQVKTLSLHDEHELTAYTDEAIINLVVTTKDTLMSEALRKNTTLRESVLSSLIKNGIVSDKIKNSKFSSSADYGWFGSKPDSYTVKNRVAIRISSAKHMQVIAEIADKKEEVEINSTQFEHSKKTEFEQQVKQMVLDKILAKKVFYEKSLGVKLTAVSFNESDVQVAPTRAANLYEEEIIVSGFRGDEKAKRSSFASQAPKPNSDSFDEVKYYARISVEFKIQ